MNPGSIYYFPDFEFEDGSTSAKMLIVICVDDNNAFIINAIPTSQDKNIPDKIQTHGCTNNDHFSFFMFEKDRVVGSRPDGKEFCFIKNTFIIVRDSVKIMPTVALLKYFGVRFKPMAHLSESEYKRLVKCVKKSKHIKRGVRKELVRLIDY